MRAPPPCPPTVPRFLLLYLWGGKCIAVWHRLMGARIGAGTVFSMTSAWDSVDIGPVFLLGGGCTLETSTICPETGDRLVRGLKFEKGVAIGVGSYVDAGSTLAQKGCGRSACVCRGWQPNPRAHHRGGRKAQERSQAQLRDQTRAAVEPDVDQRACDSRCTYRVDHSRGVSRAACRLVAASERELAGVGAVSARRRAVPAPAAVADRAQP